MGIPHLGDSWCSRVYYIKSSQQSCMNKTNLTLQSFTHSLDHRPMCHTTHVRKCLLLRTTSPFAAASLYRYFQVLKSTPWWHHWESCIETLVTICIPSHSIQETFWESVYLHYDPDTLNSYYIPNPEVCAIKKFQKQVHHIVIFLFFSLSTKVIQARLLVTCLEYRKIHVVWNIFFRNWGGLGIQRKMI